MCFIPPVLPYSVVTRRVKLSGKNKGVIEEVGTFNRQRMVETKTGEHFGYLLTQSRVRRMEAIIEFADTHRNCIIDMRIEKPRNRVLQAALDSFKGVFIRADKNVRGRDMNYIVDDEGLDQLKLLKNEKTELLFWYNKLVNDLKSNK